jgi:hypothetical protein
VKTDSIRRYVVLPLSVVGVVLLAVGHLLFGPGELPAGVPGLEGVTAMTAGLALLASLVIARRSMYRALVNACLGTLPLVGWFAYAVTIDESSDPVYFFASLITPATAGLAALTLRRRSGKARSKVGAHRTDVGRSGNRAVYPGRGCMDVDECTVGGMSGRLVVAAK